jgi:glutathionyl-hydroquinone reductase
MKKKLKTISGNDLSELIHMMNDVCDTVSRTYLHVKDHTPRLVKTIDKLRNDLISEANRREDLF